MIEEEHEPKMTDAYCRHCGEMTSVDLEATPDWLCSSCERYQDTGVCPTCHQPARLSLLPKEAVPEVHAPVRSRKEKEN